MFISWAKIISGRISFKQVYPHVGREYKLFTYKKTFSLFSERALLVYACSTLSLRKKQKSYYKHFEER